MKRLLALLLIVWIYTSAIPVSAQTGNHINVKDAPYNAKGDGITDDTEAIHRAIRASQPGDTVYFPNGVYLLSDGLKPKSQTRLMGESKDGSILRYTYLPGPWGSFIFGGGESESSSNTKEIELCHFTVDGNLIESQDGRALNFSYTSGIYIHDMIVQNIAMPTHAINFRVGVTDSIIENNEIYNVGVGTRWGDPVSPDTGVNGGSGIHVAWGSERIKILRNKIVNANRNGIGCDNGARYLVIRNNEISGTGINNPSGEALGLELWQDCDYSIVEDNVVDTWISLVRSKYLAARRNHVEMPETIETLCGDPYGYELHSLYSVYTNNVSIGHDEGLVINGTDPEQFSPQYNYFAHNVFSEARNFGGNFFASEQGGNFNQYFYQNDFIHTRKDVYPGKAGANINLSCQTKNYTFEACKFNNGRLGICLDSAPGLDGIYIFDSEIKNNTKTGATHYVEPGGAMTKTYQPANGSAMTAFEIENTEIFENEDNGVHPNLPFQQQRPHCSFDAPASVRAGESVCVSNGSENGSNTDTYLWDFGDGLPATGASASHVYETPGMYEITLVVWNESGRASRKTQTIEVTAPFPYTVTNVQANESGKITVDYTQNTPRDEADVVAAAAYGSDGQMLACSMREIDPAGQQLEVKLAIPPNETVSEIRVFVWNLRQDLTPLSRVYACP